MKISKLIRQYGEHGNDYSVLEIGDKVNEILFSLVKAGIIEHDEDDIKEIKKELQPILEPKKVGVIFKDDKGGYVARCPASGDKVYYILNKEKHWIRNPETLTKLGFNFQRIVNIPNEEMDTYETGDGLDLAEKKPLEVIKPKDGTDKYNL